MTVVEQAQAFAQKAHEGQMYGKFPYMVHLDDVHEILARITDDETVLAAAYLHDVFGDCPAYERELVESFDKEIVDIVRFCTKSPFFSRSQNLKLLCDRINTAPPYSKAIAVKLADRLANTAACVGKSFDIDKFKMYVDEFRYIQYAVLDSPNITEDSIAFTVYRELDYLHRKESATIDHTHKLKIWPEYFESVSNGTKPFEVRKNDRNYRVGDILVLQEYRKDILEYTGRICVKQVTYILKGGDFGIAPNFCVLGLKDR